MLSVAGETGVSVGDLAFDVRVTDRTGQPAMVTLTVEPSSLLEIRPPVAGSPRLAVEAA